MSMWKREAKKRPSLECAHFPIKPRLTERFWRIFMYSCTLADRQNDYLNTMFARDTTPVVLTKITIHFISYKYINIPHR